MALFPDDVTQSLRAAVGMITSLNEFNKVSDLSDELKIGIGLHFGSLMLGTVGYSARLNATVIADTVNISSRLEGLTKGFGVQVLVSETVVDQIGDKKADDLHFRKIGKFYLKGKDVPYDLYELYDPSWDSHTDTDKLEQFAQALSVFSEGDIKAAHVKFMELCRKHPDDKLFQFYDKTCKLYKSSLLPPKWKGEIKMDKDGNSVAFPVRKSIKDLRVKIEAEMTTPTSPGGSAVVEEDEGTEAQNPNAVDVNGDSLIMKMTSKDDMEAIRNLLKNPNLKIHYKNNVGNTVLHRAAFIGSAAVLDAIFHSRDVCVDVTNKNHETPLHLAAGKGNVSAVLCLLNHGADIDATNVVGDTALMGAAHFGKHEVVKILLERGASPNVKNWKGVTPLMRATRNGCEKTIGCLQKHGAAN
ncbi:hypothetical protein AKO1_002129 [Acrasis kona]|uniref:Guanylate cyclase domain-containing protein n=1 Tax=Acrasis kona TaxID=1008807 RepID=A0AAW2ZAD4_9EUKA